MSEDIDEMRADARPYPGEFDPDAQVAYCKYCYRTHDDWLPADNTGPGFWTCRLCEHTSGEEWMTIYDLLTL